MLYNHEPTLQYLKVIGYECYATNFSNHDKFSARAIKSVLLEYGSHHEGYELFDLYTYNFCLSRGVMFNEYVFHFTYVPIYLSYVLHLIFQLLL